MTDELDPGLETARQIFLDAIVGKAQAEELHDDLMEEDGDIDIDGTRVEHISTLALQVIVAASKEDRKVSLKNRSEPLEDVLRRIGLAEQVG